jgi:uncharacterized membrane protein YjjP (DUF1212 family)
MRRAERPFRRRFQRHPDPGPPASLRAGEQADQGHDDDAGPTGGRTDGAPAERAHHPRWARPTLTQRRIITGDRISSDEHLLRLRQDERGRPHGHDDALRVGVSEQPRDLPAFIVALGAALNASGQPVDVVQSQLSDVARAYGAPSIQVTALPTYLMVTMGTGEPAILELTTPVGLLDRLDQVAAIDRLARDGTAARMTPTEGLMRLDAIAHLPHRYAPITGIVGSGVLSAGVCLILKGAPADVAAAAVLGLLVGLMRRLLHRQSGTRVLLPVLAAFVVSAACALFVRAAIDGPGLDAIVAALVVFLPGAALTTGVMELGEGQMIASASRLVTGATELALLAFGILMGIQAVGVPSGLVFAGPDARLGAWAPWLGVAVFALGVTIANSAPERSLPGLLLVLYVAWAAQVTANALLGGYASAVIGATALTLAALAVSRVPTAMPSHALFLPGFWLLVPGAMGLIGLTKLTQGGVHARSDLLVAVGSIFGVALGVLIGSEIWRSGRRTAHVVTSARTR